MVSLQPSAWGMGVVFGCLKPGDAMTEHKEEYLGGEIALSQYFIKCSGNDIESAETLA